MTLAEIREARQRIITEGGLEYVLSAPALRPSLSLALAIRQTADLIRQR